MTLVEPKQRGLSRPAPFRAIAELREAEEAEIFPGHATYRQHLARFVTTERSLLAITEGAGLVWMR